MIEKVQWMKQAFKKYSVRYRENRQLTGNNALR
jgi:hypothetical protein